MPAPAARYEILPARGTKANLDAAIADIAENELCYATDEEALYVKVGGVLVPASGSGLNGGQIAGFRNKIINGACQVAQRGTSVTGVSSAGNRYLTCDRWVFGLTSLGTWNVTQSTTAPDGFSNSFGLSCTAGKASPASADKVNILTRLEGQDLQDLQYGTSGAKAVTLSFWVKSNVTGATSLAFRQVDSGRMYSTTDSCK